MAGLLLLTSASAFYFKSREVDKHRIYFDENLQKGKEDYLNELVQNPDLLNKFNVVLILADDLGPTDISLYSDNAVHTPHINALAAQGATFANGYITSPVCSPSRAGLLTGRYQQRFGHEFQPNHRYLRNIIEYYGFKWMPKFRPLVPIKELEVPSTEERLRQGLPPSEITLAEALRKYGYKSGLFGKWHLGTANFAQPCNRGFDEHYGFYEAFTMYADPTDKSVVGVKVKGDYKDYHQWKTAEGRQGNCAILRNCNERQEDSKYLTDKLTDEAIDFIGRHQDKPFFCYIPYSSPHAPLQVPATYYEQFAHIKDPVKRVYAAMIKNLDDQVGRVVHTVDSLGLSKNTLIIFLSDNGGASYNGTTDNAPYRGGKLTNFEGGIKVPFVMRWVGHIPAGTYYSYPVTSLDIFSTVMANVGAALPTDRYYDGVNLLPYLKGAEKGLPHQQLFWRSDFNKAMIDYPWKYIVNEYTGIHQLYNLAADSTEQHNLFANQKDTAQLLAARLLEWENTLVKPLWPRVVNYVYKDGQGKHVFAF